MIRKVQCIIFLVCFATLTPKEYSHDKQVGLEQLNQMREKIAEEMEIANMHRIDWDDGLAEEAQKRVDKEEDTCPKDLSDGREEIEIAMSFYMRDEKILKVKLTEVLTPPKNATNGTSGANKKTDNSGKSALSKLGSGVKDRVLGSGKKKNATEIQEGDNLGQLVKVWPTYSKIGCVECQRGKELPFITLCHFGPKSSWKRSDVKKGTPGTECEKGKVVENGLCADEFIKRDKKPKKEELTSYSKLPLGIFISLVFFGIMT